MLVEHDCNMVKQQKTIESVEGARWIVSFGQRLEQARGRMGLTQAEIAAGELSKSFVSLLETARSYPSVETLLLLARRTGTSVAGLLMDPPDLRLDTALSMIALARDAVWRQPKWAERVSRFAEEVAPGLPLWARAEAAIVRGIAATLDNRLPEAERWAREAQSLAKKAGFGPGEAQALALLGDVALLRRDYARSFDLLSQAVARHRETGSLRSAPGVKALIWLAAAALRVGRTRFARRCCTRARLLAVRLNLGVLEGQALWGLGYIAQLEGDLPRAAKLLQEARRAFELAEDLPNLAEVLMNLSILYREQGRLQEALEAAQRSVGIIKEQGNLRRRSDAYQDLAAVHLQMGHLPEAEEAARQALADAEKAGDSKHRATALALLGRIAARRQERDQAVHYLRRAARELKALGLKDLWAEVSRDLGLVLKGSSPESEAALYLTQAINPEALLGGVGPPPAAVPTRRRRAARNGR
ncbi:MAG: tetratricopeptide repeat protein [Armatimonadota bacterium]|nr:tetratricopeptide repeat protein [Armatimonadota bacterium]MDR7470103.1 tetratricopeptide repeat protein [Armatimonadota bacterium]